MKRNKDIQKELEDFAPFLSKLDKKEDFAMPDNYFDNLQKEVLAKVSKDETVSLKSSAGRIRPLFSARYAAGIAAMILLAVASFLFFNTTNQQTLISAIDEISNDEISTYITANIDEFEEELFFDMEDDEFLNFLPEEINFNDTDSSIDEILDEFDIEALEKLL